MPTYTPVIDNGGELYNVKAYNVVGDGSTDDAPAILNAMQAARKTDEFGTVSGEGQPVLIPSGRYRVNTPLNMTSRQMNLRGSGPYQSVVRGNTGAYGWGVLVDMTGSGFSTIRDLHFDMTTLPSLPLPTLPNPSVIGILQARRPETGSDSLCNHLFNVVVRLDDTPALQSNGTYGIVNIGCETTTYESVYVQAHTALFLGENNLSGDNDPAHIFRVTSPFVGTIMQAPSMTVVSVRGTSNLVGLGGPAVRIRGAGDIDLGDSALLGRPGSANTINPYAIEVLGQVHNLRYAGSVEGFPSLLHVQGGTATDTVTGLVLDCYMLHQPNVAHIVMAPGTTLTGGRLNVVPTAGSPGGGMLIRAEAGTPGVTVQGLDIDLYDQGIDLTSAGTLKGCVIRSKRTLAQTLAGIVAGTMTGNVIVASDGAQLG